MTQEKQRKAIAKACGWTEIQLSEYAPFGNPYLVGRSPNRVAENLQNIPDFCNDLNAMHEAEKVLYADQLVDYVKHLAAIHPLFCVDVLDDRDPAGDWHFEMTRLITATAAQRAEAFLRTIGKWEES